jgi:hypothetical protein
MYINFIDISSKVTARGHIGLAEPKTSTNKAKTRSKLLQSFEVATTNTDDRQKVFLWRSLVSHRQKSLLSRVTSSDEFSPMRTLGSFLTLLDVAPIFVLLFS